MKLFFTPLLLLLSSSIFAQDGSFSWAKAISGSSIEACYSTVTDNQNNVYVTGYFYNTADFDPSGSTFFLSSSGLSDVFIAKYNSNGDFQWAKKIGGTLSDVGYSISTDSINGVYLCGQFNGTVDFDPSLSSYTLTSMGQEDAFVCKLDTSGVFQWAKSFGGIQEDYAISISSKSTGEIIVTGNFMGIVDFDPSPISNTISSVGPRDIFISLFNTNGDLVWVKTIGGMANEDSRMVKFDKVGNVYCVGQFFGTCDFDPNLGFVNRTSLGQYDSYILKLNANGNYVWVSTFGGKYDDAIYTLDLTSQNEVIIGGHFNDTCDFDSGPLETKLISKGNDDIFFCKLSSIGDFQWVKQIAGIAQERVMSLTIDASDYIISTGFFYGSVDFDPGNNSILLNSSTAGFSDVFILKLNVFGDYVWAKKFGGSKSDYSYSISLQSNSGIITSGIFNGTVDFDPSGQTFNISSFNSIAQDAFIHRLNNLLINIIDENELLKCNLFPNPLSTFLHIRANSTFITKIEIFNTCGVLIDTPLIDKDFQGNLTLDFTKYKPDIYYVKIRFQNNHFETHKIIIED